MRGREGGVGYVRAYNTVEMLCGRAGGRKGVDRAIRGGEEVWPIASDRHLLIFERGRLYCAEEGSKRKRMLSTCLPAR